MEKDGAAAETAVPMPNTDELSQASSSMQSREKEDNGNRLALRRTISGPPYTIFSRKAKTFILVSVSISSLISPFGATTFYPALNVLAKDLHVTPSLINLSLTTYMVRFS